MSPWMPESWPELNGSGNGGRKLLLSTEGVLKVLIFYAGFWLAAICLDQRALEMTVLVRTGSTLVIAMPVWAYIDALRFGRWSSDYRRAIPGFVKRFIARNNATWGQDRRVAYPTFRGDQLFFGPFRTLTFAFLFSIRR